MLSDWGWWRGEQDIEEGNLIVTRRLISIHDLFGNGVLVRGAESDFKPRDWRARVGGFVMHSEGASRIVKGSPENRTGL